MNVSMALIVTALILYLLAFSESLQLLLLILIKGLCSRISKVMFLTGNKQLAGSMKMLQNTLRRGVTILSRFSRPRALARSSASSRSTRYSTRSEPTLTRNILAGKRLDTYIFPSADFWASRVYYLDTYTVNLEFDDDFPVVYDLLYIQYIYILLFTVRGHPVPGQYTQGLFYILWFIFP